MSYIIVCNECGVEFNSIDKLKTIVEDNDHNDTILEEKRTCPECGEVDNFQLIEQNNPKWEDDSIQFPRLLAEINACVDISLLDWQKLQESMNLSEGNILDLFERANQKWEMIKKSVQAGVISKKYK